MSAVPADLPRMIARVASHIAREAELPRRIRLFDIADALAAIAAAAEAIATAETEGYAPAQDRLKAFDR